MAGNNKKNGMRISSKDMADIDESLSRDPQAIPQLVNALQKVKGMANNKKAAKFDTTGVCEDCYMAAANGYEPELWGRVAHPMPLNQMSGLEVVPSGNDGHFSHYPCPGCGKRFSGNRYDVHYRER